MALSSITLIFLFLPIFLLLFYILPYSNWRNGVLVVASLIFIGWIDMIHLPLLVGILLLTYGLGIVIGNLTKQKKKQSARIFMWVAVSVNLLPLLFYKYSAFIVQSLAALAKINLTLEAKALPLGISYFTFSAISYVLDVYHGSEKAERNFIRLLNQSRNVPFNQS